MGRICRGQTTKTTEFLEVLLSLSAVSFSFFHLSSVKELWINVGPLTGLILSRSSVDILQAVTVPASGTTVILIMSQGHSEGTNLTSNQRFFITLEFVKRKLM